MKAEIVNQAILKDEMEVGTDEMPELGTDILNDWIEFKINAAWMNVSLFILEWFFLFF